MDLFWVTNIWIFFRIFTHKFFMIIPDILSINERTRFNIQTSSLEKPGI